MGWVVTAVGAGLILVVLRDLFFTLWHPSRQGSLTRLATRGTWRAFGLRRGRFSEHAGPVGALLAMLLWTALIVLGWALVYAPHMSGGFSFDPRLDPATRSSPLDALYLSLVTTATLGYGDIVPQTAWLRIAAPLQAVGGFALLTAAVSWILQIYPALTRRRSLALRFTHLQRSGAADVLGQLDPSTAAQLLDGLAADVATSRTDLNQYSETYYFRDGDPRASLPATIGYAPALVAAGQASPSPDVRLGAAMLSCALDDFADVLTRRFVATDGSTPRILEAYAADHGHGRD